VPLRGHGATTGAIHERLVVTVAVGFASARPRSGPGHDSALWRRKREDLIR
jgi:hypothetical protein